jgi:hypothetical protein
MFSLGAHGQYRPEKPPTQTPKGIDLVTCRRNRQLSMVSLITREGAPLEALGRRVRFSLTSGLGDSLRGETRRRAKRGQAARRGTFAHDAHEIVTVHVGAAPRRRR